MAGRMNSYHLLIVYDWLEQWEWSENIYSTSRFLNTRVNVFFRTCQELRSAKWDNVRYQLPSDVAWQFWHIFICTCFAIMIRTFLTGSSDEKIGWGHVKKFVFILIRKFDLRIFLSSSKFQKIGDRLITQILLFMIINQSSSLHLSIIFTQNYM